MTMPYLTGIVFFGACVLFSLGLATSAWFAKERKSTAGLVVLAAVFSGSWYAINYPAFNLQYHSYTEVTGKVTEVERVNETWMFELKDDPRNLECTESWCAKVEVGDTLTLECVRDTPGAANIWECEFINLKETDRA